MKSLHWTLSALILIVLNISVNSFASGRLAAGSPTQLKESVSCANLLAPNEQIISTLRELYKDRVLTMQDLVAIQNGENPLEKMRVLNAHMFGDVIAITIDQLKRSSKARRLFAEWVQTIQTQVRDRQVQVIETGKPFLSMTMYAIPRENSYAADIPVTQWQYSFVMRNLKEPNPSHWQSGPTSRIVEIAGREVLMQPNNPVEMVTWDDAQKFIKVLNRWSSSDNPGVYKIIQNHIKYARVRLLTNRDWENLIRNGSEWKEKYPNGITEKNLHKFAWYDENSGKMTHPVAELNSLVISGHPFFDLLGNVWEWVENQEGDTRVTRGGCNYESAIHLRSPSCLGLYPDMRYPAVGFRVAEDPP